jgi:murein DD-endopeptidase MepM/ murein hydrolase activator NlpD
MSLKFVTLISALFFVAACTTAGGESNDLLAYPPEAPKIASGFQSWIGVNGLRRSNLHQGIDIKGNDGQQILAVADGTVLEATEEKCWGPTIAVDHGKGKDDKEIVALYGHVGVMLVAAHDKVKRGQIIALLGNNQDKFKCIYGVRHLHFQIGREYRDQFNKGDYWGWAYFLKDGAEGINPHLYWADGPNKVTCFESNKKYTPGTITYPVPCG